MAERLNVDRPRRRTFYPWDDWTDGTTWSAVEGVDFTTNVGNFQTALHLKAKSINKKVVTGSPRKGVVEFRFMPIPSSEGEDLPSTSGNSSSTSKKEHPAPSNYEIATGTTPMLIDLSAA